ncbi:MAG: Rid family hydrolase [Pseudomonadota bacterium]
MRRALTPEAYSEAAKAAGMSPAIASGDFIFLTGVTGSGSDGVMPEAPKDQFNAVFEKIAQTLAVDGLGLDAIVEMTSYHIRLREHFSTFDAVRLARFSPPYPAWTAVEVAGLRREGAVVEVRAIAARK